MSITAVRVPRWMSDRRWSIIDPVHLRRGQVDVTSFHESLGVISFFLGKNRSVKSVRMLRWMSYQGYKASSTRFICDEDKSVWRVFVSLLMWLVLVFFSVFFAERNRSVKSVRMLRWMSYPGHEASSTRAIRNEDTSMWRVFVSLLMWLVTWFFFREETGASNLFARSGECLTWAMKPHRTGSFATRISRCDEFSWVSWCD